MKKILITIMILLTFTLISCGNSNQELETKIDDLEIKIDILEERLADTHSALLEMYVITDNGKLYSNCRLEDGIKVCDEISVVTDEELQLNLRYWFNEYCGQKVDICSFVPILEDLKDEVRNHMILDDDYLYYVSYIDILKEYCEVKE